MLELIVDLELEIYRSVRIVTETDEAMIDFDGRPPEIPAVQHDGWKSHLVLTLEAENRWDCGDEKNLASPSSGTVFYDDLSFVGELLPPADGS